MANFACTNCGALLGNNDALDCAVCGSDAVVDASVAKKCSHYGCDFFAIDNAGNEPLCNEHFAETVI
jgi:hypothetical protein